MPVSFITLLICKCTEKPEKLTAKAVATSESSLVREEEELNRFAAFPISKRLESRALAASLLIAEHTKPVSTEKAVAKPQAVSVFCVAELTARASENFFRA